MKQNKIVVAVGQKGKGKSHLLQQLVTGRENVLWVDVLGAFAHAMMTDAEFEREMPGFIRTGDFGLAARRILPDLLSYSRRPFRIVFLAQGKQGRLDALRAFFTALKRRYLRYRQESTIVLDEVQMFATNGSTHYPDVIHDIPSIGRHFRLNQYYAVRRPFELPTDIRANADDYYLFATREPGDLKYFRGVIPSIEVPRLATLKITQYGHYDVRKDEMSWMLDPPPF